MPILNDAQLIALRDDIMVNLNTITIAGDQQVAIKDVFARPEHLDLAPQVADWYNQQAAGPFFGNYATVPVDDIFNAVIWKNFTPTDDVPTVTALPASPSAAQQATYNNQVASVHIWAARNGMCQTLQVNVQTFLLGRTIINATKGKIRSAFQDALSLVPSGTAGVKQDAGWTAVQKVLCRKLSNIEKLFADASAPNDGSTNLLAATCSFEGLISGFGDQSDIVLAWTHP